MAKNFEYFNRELSWLSFNYRVLEEIKDKSLPLFERIKFMAIYSSNIDEFYRVRVANIRNVIGLSKENIKSLDYNPEELLNKITDEVKKQQKEFVDLFYNEIIPELERNDIILYLNQKLDKEHIDFIDNYFNSEVMPYLQPVLLAKGAVLSFLQDNVIYLAIKLIRKPKNTKQSKRRFINYAILKMPTNHTPRFVVLPDYKGKHFIMFLDDVIRFNLHKIFTGYEVDSSYSLKLSRDADLNIEDEFSGNLIDKIKESISKRKTGAPSRFLYDENIPKDFLKFLKKIFKLSEKDLFEGPKYLSFNDFFDFPNPLKPKLEAPKKQPIPHPVIDRYDTVSEAIRYNDILLHFPYNSYDYVLRFLNEAAIDPKVEEIKVTQYRVASDSAVVRSLITAAMNGKKVTVFVEVKARFDEEANLRFADLMKKAGVNIIYSLPGLKVHAKVALIIKKSTRPGQKRGLAFISTGNFNEKTAQIYSDIGLFTSNDEIILELSKLFTYLRHPVDNIKFKKLLIAKFNLYEELKHKIEREIKRVKQGKRGYIILKLNGLEEPRIINKLYEASSKGVKIDLLVRGICCLIPEKTYSQNIKITRIVDRYLEHARVYVFHNDGENEVFISSADMMKRNLRRRIECAVEITEPKLKQEILGILNIQLQDNVKAVTINSKLKNIRKINSLPPTRSQEETYTFLEKFYKSNY